MRKESKQRSVIDHFKNILIEKILEERMIREMKFLKIQQSVIGRSFEDGNYRGYIPSKT
jgi:hypothetical protein